MLIVTFGETEGVRLVKTQFMVINCPSLYQCILGQLNLAKLIIVSSTVHLKVKYYTHKGLITTLYGDIEAVKRCFEAP